MRSIAVIFCLFISLILGSCSTAKKKASLAEDVTKLALDKLANDVALIENQKIDRYKKKKTNALFRSMSSSPGLRRLLDL